MYSCFLWDINIIFKDNNLYFAYFGKQYYSIDSRKVVVIKGFGIFIGDDFIMTFCIYFYLDENRDLIEVVFFSLKIKSHFKISCISTIFTSFLTSFWSLWHFLCPLFLISPFQFLINTITLYIYLFNKYINTTHWVHLVLLVFLM